MCHLTHEGKIIVFKILTVPKKNNFFFIDIKSHCINYKWARKNTKNFFVAFETRNKKLKPYALNLSMVVWKTLIYRKK